MFAVAVILVIGMNVEGVNLAAIGAGSVSVKATAANANNAILVVVKNEDFLFRRAIRVTNGARPHHHLALRRHFDQDFIRQNTGISRAPSLDINISDGLDVFPFGWTNSGDNGSPTGLQLADGIMARQG